MSRQIVRYLVCAAIVGYVTFLDWPVKDMRALGGDVAFWVGIFSLVYHSILKDEKAETPKGGQS